MGQRQHGTHGVPEGGAEPLSPLQALEGKGPAPWWGNELFYCRKKEREGKKQQPTLQKPSGKEFVLCNTAPARLQLTFPSHTFLPASKEMPICTQQPHGTTKTQRSPGQQGQERVMQAGWDVTLSFWKSPLPRHLRNTRAEPRSALQPRLHAALQGDVYTPKGRNNPWFSIPDFQTQARRCCVTPANSKRTHC